MLDRKWMLEYEKSRDEAMRTWQEQQEERAERRHIESLREARKTHTRELVIFGLVVTFIIVFATFVAALIEARLWTPPFVE